jgi:hypothetical protein
MPYLLLYKKDRFPQGDAYGAFIARLVHAKQNKKKTQRPLKNIFVLSFLSLPLTSSQSPFSLRPWRLNFAPIA